MRLLGILLVVAISSQSVAQLTTEFDGSVNMAVMSADGSIQVGADARSRSSLFRMLEDDQIREVIGLSESQLKALQSIIDSHKKAVLAVLNDPNPRDPADIRLLNANLKEAQENSIEEILLPEQYKRLENIAYRMEIARIGYAASLAKGMLGRDSGIHESQKDDLFRKVNQVESETQEEIRKLRVRCEARVLELLVPEQRNKAAELLGDFFEFKALTMQQKMQRKLEEMSKKK